MLKLELIDTLWNVNEYVARLLYTLLGINRYIMECKCGFYGVTICHRHELIDTLWNVNFFFLSISISVAAELIDTLWNVNLVGVGAASVGVARINRYIMECKLPPVLVLLASFVELIDTLWNVNRSTYFWA